MFEDWNNQCLENIVGQCSLSTKTYSYSLPTGKTDPCSEFKKKFIYFLDNLYSLKSPTTAMSAACTLSHVHKETLIL